MNLDGSLNGDQYQTLTDLITSSRKYFPRDTELRELATELSTALSTV